jgi:hypothetical protein
MRDSLTDGFIGAVLGSLISAAVVWYQTRQLLTAESKYRRQDAEREIRSLSVALLAEVDDFYRLFIRDFVRKNKGVGGPSEASRVKSSTYTAFVVFEANADKVGLFDAETAKAVVGYYGTARAYLNTMSDYGTALDRWGSGETIVRATATALFSQIRISSELLVPASKFLCALLAERAGTTYTFEEP